MKDLEHYIWGSLFYNSMIQVTVIYSLQMVANYTQSDNNVMCP